MATSSSQPSSLPSPLPASSLLTLQQIDQWGKDMLNAKRKQLMEYGWSFYTLTSKNPDVVQRLLSFIHFNRKLLHMHAFDLQVDINAVVYKNLDLDLDKSSITVFLPKCRCIENTLKRCYFIEASPISRTI